MNIPSTTRIFGVLSLGLACALGLPLSLEAAATPQKLNVLIFFIDDLGPVDLGLDGSIFHETPRIDALAKAGVRFTNFYSAHPVCSPTRAALMTGKAPQRVGITDWIHPDDGVALPAAETTLGEAFQAHGYQTAYVGKWHLGEADDDHPTRHGFEWTKGVNRGGAPGSYHFPYRTHADQSTIWDVPDFESGQKGDYLTDALTTATIEFLRQRDQARPFFLCFSHYAVHTPIQPPDGLSSKYEDKRRRIYGDNSTPTREAMFGAVSRARQDNPDYAAMVENLDTNIGRMLDALDELGLQQNTIIVFTSDNGGLCTRAGETPGPTCNLPWRSGKGWNYEGGIRIPAVISWPGQLRPTITGQLASTADLYPTLLQLAGLPLRPRQHLDGRSLVSALEGKPEESLEQRALAWYYPHDHTSGHRPSAALRRGDWKVIHYLPSGPTELYDLAGDPGETTDLSKRHSDKTESLRVELLRWIDETKR